MDPLPLAVVFDIRGVTEAENVYIDDKETYNYRIQIYIFTYILPLYHEQLPILNFDQDYLELL